MARSRSALRIFFKFESSARAKLERGKSYLCSDTSLGAAVVHKDFKNLRNDLWQVNLKQEKSSEVIGHF